MKVEKNLTEKIRRTYLEVGSVRKTAKFLDIKLWKVQKVVKELGIANPKLPKNDMTYLKDRGVTKSQLIECYSKLENFREVAKELGLGINRTKEILKNFKVLKKAGHSLKRDKSGELNPFYGKTHTEEVKEKLSEHAKKRTEKRNPNYKNGKYLRRPRDYKISAMTKLRKAVFVRDSYTCKYCNKKGGHLHAHHMIPYWVKPEAFEDMDNLVTVCTGCHFEKAHVGNWCRFDVTIIPSELIEKYSLDRERLSGLDAFSISVCDSLNSTNN